MYEINILTKLKRIISRVLQCHEDLNNGQHGTCCPSYCSVIANITCDNNTGILRVDFCSSFCHLLYTIEYSIMFSSDAVGDYFSVPYLSAYYIQLRVDQQVLHFHLIYRVGTKLCTILEHCV